MKVKIDEAKCAGHDRCYSGYPENAIIVGQ